MATIEDHDGTGGADLGTAGESVGIARAQSLLRQAKQRREERESHLFLDVPSWDGDLIAEYKVLDGDALDVIAANAARKIKSGDKDAIGPDIDVIAKANVALYMLDPDSGDRVALEDDAGKVGYDRAAHLLGVEDDINSVAKTIKYLMGERKEDGSGWKENPTAITMHATRIARWMRDPSKGGRTLEEILSES